MLDPDGSEFITLLPMVVCTAVAGSACYAEIRFNLLKVSPALLLLRRCIGLGYETVSSSRLLHRETSPPEARRHSDGTILWHRFCCKRAGRTPALTRTSQPPVRHRRMPRSRSCGPLRSRRPRTLVPGWVLEHSRDPHQMSRCTSLLPEYERLA